MLSHQRPKHVQFNITIFTTDVVRRDGVWPKPTGTDYEASELCLAVLGGGPNRKHQTPPRLGLSAEASTWRRPLPPNTDRWTYSVQYNIILYCKTINYIIPTIIYYCPYFSMVLYSDNSIGNIAITTLLASCYQQYIL